MADRNRDEREAKGAEAEPRPSVGRLLVTGLGRSGAWAALFAAVVGLACSVVVVVTLVHSLATEQFHEGQDYETRVLSLHRQNARLMHAIEGLYSGFLINAPGNFPVRTAWSDFRAALIDVCGILHAGTQGIDRLRAACSDPDALIAEIEPEMMGFDPLAHPLSTALLQGLQQLRADIMVLADHVLAKTAALEDELAEEYRRSQAVLAASALGFVLSAVVLLYLVWTASARYFKKAHEAALEQARREEAQQALIERGRYDRLTGLANRGWFLECANRAIGEAVRSGHSVAMLCVDLDDFKDINDTMGYALGDRLLKAVGERLKENAGPCGLVSRFGADEFTVLHVEESGQPAAEPLAQRLLAALAMPFGVKGGKIRTTASIGIATHQGEAIRAEILIGRADMALHRAKAKGRNNAFCYSDAIDQEVRARVGLAQAMREGLSQEEFFLVFQPRVDTRSGEVTGVEALLRWQHPTQGLVAPSLFIPIAESSGLIAELGLWVLREACLQAKRWLDAGVEFGRMGVNISALQLAVPGEFERAVGDVLDDTGLAPSRLEIEITESALMEVSRERNEVLQRLRERGVTVAIDDFGTGYSSLDYLRRLPVDRIKIAQQFVQDIAAAGSDATITRIAVLLGRALGITVLAEGVETREQVARLKLWGCHEVQGYLFAKPMAAPELATFLATREVTPMVVGRHG